MEVPRFDEWGFSNATAVCTYARLALYRIYAEVGTGPLSHDKAP